MTGGPKRRGSRKEMRKNSQDATAAVKENQLLFDFFPSSQITDIDKNSRFHTSRPKDIPFEKGYYIKSPDIKAVVYQNIELSKNNVPTRRGWKSLYNILSVYRSKQYETFRYLFIDSSGTIIDQVAVLSGFPNRVATGLDKNDSNSFARQLYERARRTKTKIVIVHNHPSGNIEPSNEDITVTKACGTIFKGYFSGHIILDHGTFGLCYPRGKWVAVEKPVNEEDPLLRKDRPKLFNTYIDSFSPENIKLLRCALSVDDGVEWNNRDWVPVFFTGGHGTIRSLHYYNASEFFAENAKESITSKTADIAKHSGSVWAFAITENESLLEPLVNITKDTNTFRDFYVNGTIGSKIGLSGSISHEFPEGARASIHSTFPLSNMPLQQEGKDRAIAAGEPETSMSIKEKDMEDNEVTEQTKEEASKASGEENKTPDKSQPDSSREGVIDTFYSGAFTSHPYQPGTRLPPFILLEGTEYKLYSGFSLQSISKNGQSFSLVKRSPRGEETINIPTTLYTNIVNNAIIQQKAKEAVEKTVVKFDTPMEQYEDKTRPNSAANFWHNYRVLCLEQASNPKEAMEVARAIVRQMPEWEQKKLRNSIRSYEKVANRPARNQTGMAANKPRETYNRRIIHYYEQYVQNLPIKNLTVHDQNALLAIRRGVESVTIPGKPIDPALKLKIGEKIKLSLECKTLLGESRKRLPITEFTVVSSSADLNKVVLLDKAGTSKYTLARDEFIQKAQKLEKRLERREKQMERFESIRY